MAGAFAPRGFTGIAPKRNQSQTASLKQKSCRECGASYAAQRATREFCCTACRRAFSNRRMLRGANFYDLIMAMRFDRAAAADEGAWTLLCKMAAAFKAEDDRQRGGRKSWDDVPAVRTRNSRLQSIVVGVNIGRAPLSGLVRERRA
jgi:hypothetical protein